MQILLVLLLFGGVFGMASFAEPVTPLTVGFVPGSAGLVREAADAHAAAEIPRPGRPEGLPANTSLPAVAVSSPPAPPKERPITLAADQLDYDGESRVFQASGSTTLQQGATTLTAERLLWQESTRDAVASGQVVLTEAEGELHGSRVHANLGSGLGQISDGRMLLRERNFHLAGAEIERLGESTYRLSDGRFTTCDGEVPDWQFTADQVDVTLGRYVTASDVWFEIRDQPLLYLPYLILPVSSQRQSGFLLPRAGYSDRKGAMFSLAWYQVIDRNLDATVYLDYLSSLGLGKGLEYRYVLSGGNQGEALFYHVSGFDDTPDSFAFDWRHDGRLPGDVRLAADVQYVNKREFFEDFGESAEEYNQDLAVSTLMVQRNWEKLNLTGYARYIKDLDNNEATIQRLPELGMDVPFFRLGTEPLYARTELRATSFTREEGEEGQRLLLRQGLGLELKPGSWLEFTPEVAVYGRSYHADSGDEHDLIPEYSATLSARLIRTYSFEHWGIERLQHSIEPQLRYLYVPNENQDELPEFDLMDRIEPRNLIEYALVNRLTARSIGIDGAPTYRELLNLRFSQAYDIREERDAAIDDPEPFSDLRTELTLRPTVESILTMDATNRVYGDLQITRFDAGAGYDDGRGNQALLDYTYRRAGLAAEATDYLGIKLATAWLDPVHLSLEERYDFRAADALESLIGLEYRAKCWSLFLSFRDRPDSQEFLVGFALSGLGQVGGFGSTLRPRVEQR